MVSHFKGIITEINFKVVKKKINEKIMENDIEDEIKNNNYVPKSISYKNLLNKKLQNHILYYKDLAPT